MESVNSHTTQPQLLTLGDLEYFQEEDAEYITGVKTQPEVISSVSTPEVEGATSLQAPQPHQEVISSVLPEAEEAIPIQEPQPHQVISSVLPEVEEATLLQEPQPHQEVISSVLPEVEEATPLQEPQPHQEVISSVLPEVEEATLLQEPQPHQEVISSVLPEVEEATLLQEPQPHQEVISSVLPEVEEATLLQEPQPQQEVISSPSSEVEEHFPCPPEGRIKVQIGRFHELPKSNIPQEAIENVGKGQILGVDTYGYIFVEFPDRESDHMSAMAQMNQVYRDINLQNMAIGKNAIDVGEIIVGKVETTVNGEGVDVFLRVQVALIKKLEDVVIAVDIDDQIVKTFHTSQLFWLIEHFHKIPMRGVKCRLAGLEEFEGTSLITDAMRSCNYNDFNMMIRVLERDRLDKYKLFPKVVLYSSQLELSTGAWSFNHDLLEVIRDWNKPPLDFLYDMVLTDVRITHVTLGGEVSIQFQSALMNELSNLRPLENLAEVDQSHIFYQVTALRKNGCDNFVKKVDGKYRRVAVLKTQRRSRKKRQDWNEEDDAVILIDIDYGTIDQYGRLSDLLPFSYFPKVLETVPPQMFKATLQNKEKDTSLTADDMKLLLTTNDIKIVFSEVRNSRTGKPVIAVYLPREIRKPTPDIYTRYLLPIEEQYKKAPGRQFEYNFDHKKVRSRYLRHIGVLEYECVRARDQ